MFIDEWFTTFYKQLDLRLKAAQEFGQLCWTHAYYTYENLQVWRPIAYDNEPTKTIATVFRIESAGVDAFRKKLPLGAPKLETNEEFIVVRAKRRPVVIIQPEIQAPGMDNKGFRGKPQRQVRLVAPVFGLADTKTGEAEFNPEIVDRVRRMEYPHLMFLPSKPGLLEVDSWLRLDHIQTVFTRHLDPTQYALADEVGSILKEQTGFLFTGELPDQ